MPDSITVTTFQMTPDVAQHWGWFLALGIALALLGLVAIIRSFAATVASMLFFGWLLIFGGAIELIDSFMVGHWAGFFLHLLAAVFLIIIGILFVSRPLLSAEVVTLMMSFFLLAIGLYQVIGSLWFHMQGWGWQLSDGILSMLMGGLLLSQWPLSGLWVIGLFVGIHLLVSGVGWTSLALTLRRVAQI
jgi:uncharacterized membrane protein HdeD (DUF308 family)